MLDICRAQGEDALSTVAVTRRAGVAQSTFYVHFDNIDEALESAAAEMGSALRTQIARARGRSLAGPGTPYDMIRNAYAASVEALLAEREMTSLALRFRRDPRSPVGRAYRDVMQKIHDDLAMDMRALGLSEAQMPAFNFQVDIVIAMTNAIVEGVLDGRLPNADVGVDVAAQVTASALTAVLAAGGLAAPT